MHTRKRRYHKKKQSRKIRKKRGGAIKDYLPKFLKSIPTPTPEELKQIDEEKLYESMRSETYNMSIRYNLFFDAANNKKNGKMDKNEFIKITTYTKLNNSKDDKKLNHQSDKETIQDVVKIIYNIVLIENNIYKINIIEKKNLEKDEKNDILKNEKKKDFLNKKHVEKKDQFDEMLKKLEALENTETTEIEKKDDLTKIVNNDVYYIDDVENKKIYMYADKYDENNYRVNVNITKENDIIKFKFYNRKFNNEIKNFEEIDVLSGNINNNTIYNEPYLINYGWMVCIFDIKKECIIINENPDTIINENPDTIILKSSTEIKDIYKKYYNCKK